MAVTVQRPDSTKPREWEAVCEEHLIGLASSKPSCLAWADRHITEAHPADRVQVLN